MNTDLGPGTVFAGRYVIGQVLGDGGYGRVFEAQDHEVGRRVALKVLRPDLQNGYSHEKRERFRREAATVANLQDPHTVTLFDHGETADGLLYMVFEFVNGTPLNELIRRGPLRAEPATRIIRQVLQSLREAHAAGILHRDLKPENIIVHDYGDEQYRAKLVDFGLAKSTLPNGEVPLTATGLVMGTAAYVSPEAYRLEQLTPASDLFGLGLVFYEMVVGHAANRAGSAMEIATQMVDRSEFEVPHSVPEPTRSIIARMIRKNPAERFQSASEVLAALPETTLDSPFNSGLIHGAAAPYASAARSTEDQTRPSVPRYGSDYQQAPAYASQAAYAPAYGSQAGYPQPGYQPAYGTGGAYPSGGYSNGYSHGYDQHDPTRPPTLIEGQRAEDLLGDPNRPPTLIQSHGEYNAHGQYNSHAQYNAHGQYNSYDQYGQHDSYAYPQQGYYPEQGAPPQPTQRHRGAGGGVVGFTIALVLILFTISAALIVLLDIRLPWDSRGRADQLEPKIFDLTRTDTTFLYVDWKHGVQIAHDPGAIPAAGRCALILDSISDPTPQGSYYVINALEPVDAQVTAYAVGREELKLIAENCYAAAQIAESVENNSIITASETKINNVERRNAQREERRRTALEMETEDSGGQPDISKIIKGGSGLNVIQQFLK